MSPQKPDPSTRSISASRTITAPPEQLFAILRDPAMHAVIDGSSTVKAARETPGTLLSKGSKFSMSMRMGVPYVMSNTVQEYVENERIAWSHFGGHRWRYDFEPVEGGTLVTETFDWGVARIPKMYELMGLPERHKETLAKTLAKLDEVATASVASAVEDVSEGFD